MTPDDARLLLGAAADAAELGHWGTVGHLLRPVHEQGELDVVTRGEAAYLLGLAAFDAGDPSAARELLNEAAMTAGPDRRTDARHQLLAIGRIEAGREATAGRLDVGRSPAVLAAADETLARGDTDTAFAFYWAVFDGHAADALRVRAALGIAKVYARRGDLVSAGQYAEYVADTGPSAYLEPARALLAKVRTLTRARVAVADGATIDTFALLNDAAHAAFADGDHAQALPLLVAMADSRQLGSIERAYAALNAGIAELVLGMSALARDHLEFALARGSDGTARRALARLAAMDRIEQAGTVVARLEH